MSAISHLQIISYSTLKFNWREKIEYLFNSPLELLHSIEYYPLFSRETDQATMFHQKFYKSFDDLFKVDYLTFLAEVIFPYVKDNLVYQKVPTFRVGFPNNVWVGEYHKDSWYGHPEEELNFLIPITDMYGTKSLYIESAPDKGDFQPQVVKYGEILHFDHTGCKHGNEINQEGTTHISFDFRIIPHKNYKDNSSAKSINTRNAFQSRGLLRFAQVSMKALIIGSTGIVGKELYANLSTSIDVIGISKTDIDISSNINALEGVINASNPDMIINACGCTDIDLIENNKTYGFTLNCLLPYYLASICQQTKTYLIHFSSDNVFDGTKLSPYVENDNLKPINYYGWTKAQADKILTDFPELSVTIFRISGVYSKIRKNFFTSFIRKLEEPNTKKIPVVNDISVTPTPSFFIAKTLSQLVLSKKIFEMSHIYNLVPNSSTTWFGFAESIVKSLNIGSKFIYPVSVDEYSTEVKRPKMCLLSNQKINTVIPIEKDWEILLHQFLKRN